MRLVWVVIPFVLIGIIGVQSADALWGERHPRELLTESETVFVGIIQSVNVIEHEWSSKKEFLENGTMKTDFDYHILELDEYTIKVEEFLKNPQESDTITLVQATVSTWGATPMKGFEIGDRVLFYIPSIQYDGLKQYSHESFKIPQLDCKPRPLVEKPCTSVVELKQMLAEEGIIAPLKQIQSGFPAEHVRCKEGLELVFKSSNNSPACVTSETAEKLIERGWAINKHNPEYIVLYSSKSNTDFTDDSSAPGVIIPNDQEITLSKIPKLGETAVLSVILNLKPEFRDLSGSMSTQKIILENGFSFVNTDESTLSLTPKTNLMSYSESLPVTMNIPTVFQAEITPTKVGNWMVHVDGGNYKQRHTFNFIVNGHETILLS